MSNANQETQENRMEQLQASHRARLDGSILHNLNKDSVQFQEILPNCDRAPKKQVNQQPKQTITDAVTPQPNSYLNYATQLLEQMRGVYASSWDPCSCGSAPGWYGGYNHFYDPCSGTTDIPPVNNCPPFDCNSNSCCNDSQFMPKPSKPSVPDYSCGTTTYYDDCAYQLKKVTEQLDRIEMMTKEMYAANQQLFSHLIAFYSQATSTSTTSNDNTNTSC